MHMCMRMQVPAEAGVVGSPGAGVTGSYELGEYAEFYAAPDSVWECITAALCE